MSEVEKIEKEADHHPYRRPVDAATLILSLLLLQPVKGAVVGVQWALRMHGFDEQNPEK
jgi:hypothetical protein